MLNAAAAVFARRGFHGARMREVARAAGLTTGALYARFDGKEALFLALAARHFDDWLARVDAVAGATGVDAVAGAAGRAVTAVLEDDPAWALLFMEFWLYAARKPRLQAAWDERRRRFRTALARAAGAAARRAGLRLTAPAEDLAAAVDVVLNGLAFERATDCSGAASRSYGALFARLLGAVLRDGTTPRSGS